MTGLDHVAILVSDLDAAVKLYRDVYGLHLDEIEEVPTEKVRVAIFGHGLGRVELVCPTDPESPMAKRIKEKGEGLHHVCLAVPDIQKAMDSLTAAARRSSTRCRAPARAAPRWPSSTPRGAAACWSSSSRAEIQGAHRPLPGGQSPPGPHPQEEAAPRAGGAPPPDPQAKRRGPTPKKSRSAGRGREAPGPHRSRRDSGAPREERLRGPRLAPVRDGSRPSLTGPGRRGVWTRLAHPPRGSTCRAARSSPPPRPSSPSPPWPAPRSPRRTPRRSIRRSRPPSARRWRRPSRSCATSSRSSSRPPRRPPSSWGRWPRGPSSSSSSWTAPSGSAATSFDALGLHRLQDAERAVPLPAAGHQNPAGRGTPDRRQHAAPARADPQRLGARAGAGPGGPARQLRARQLRRQHLVRRHAVGPLGGRRSKRAWGEVETPVGLISFGRMPVAFGLGLVNADADGLDDDWGDSQGPHPARHPAGRHAGGPAQHRASPTTSTPPGRSRPNWRQGAGTGQPFTLDPKADGRTWNVKVMRLDTADELRRKLEQGGSSLNCGGVYAYSTQSWAQNAFFDETARHRPDRGQRTSTGASTATSWTCGPATRRPASRWRPRSPASPAASAIRRPLRAGPGLRRRRQGGPQAAAGRRRGAGRLAGHGQQARADRRARRRLRRQGRRLRQRGGPAQQDRRRPPGLRLARGAAVRPRRATGPSTTSASTRATASTSSCGGRSSARSPTPGT